MEGLQGFKDENAKQNMPFECNNRSAKSYAVSPFVLTELTSSLYTSWLSMSQHQHEYINNPAVPSEIASNTIQCSL